MSLLKQVKKKVLLKDQYGNWIGGKEVAQLDEKGGEETLKLANDTQHSLDKK